MLAEDYEKFKKLRGTPPSEISLKQKIDIGGVSDIWLATHPSLDFPFVVKYSKDTVKNNLYLYGQFEREFEAVQTICEHHIEYCTGVVVDFDVDVYDHPYLFVEFLRAKPLDALFPKIHDWETMRDILRQVVHHLSAIHSIGIVHRDIKPANIVINDHGEVKIIDFALSTIDGNWHRYHSEGMAIGTPLYMSPEQAYGQKILLTSASDWYGIGVMLYEWLSGKVPFHGETPTDTIRMHCYDPVPPLNNINVPDAPEAFLDIVIKLLCKEPNARFSAVRMLRSVIY